MTPRANYAAFVDKIFGAGSAKFDITKISTNRVLDALAVQRGTKFTANFQERLRRINAAIKSDPSLREVVIDAVNRVAEDEWDGAYAELCALDYFLGSPLTGVGVIELDRTVPASDTLASEMGMQRANHDMRLKSFGVSMDTKNLSDKTGKILDGIFDKFRETKGIEKMTILPTYDHDADFTPFAANRQQLLSELINGVDMNEKTPRLASRIIPGLSYEFVWESGVYFSWSTYSPLDHVRRHHTLLFGHVKKFSRVEPTAIVYVMFPWSGEKEFFVDDNEVFETAFGKHFFNNYLGSTDLAKGFNGKIKTDITAAEVTRYLSGVIFLKDDSIVAEDSTQINIKASFIWNRNAIHSLVGHPLHDELLRRDAVDRG